MSTGHEGLKPGLWPGPAERHSAQEFTGTPDAPELAKANTELFTRPRNTLLPGYKRAPLH